MRVSRGVALPWWLPRCVPWRGAPGKRRARSGRSSSASVQQVESSAGLIRSAGEGISAMATGIRSVAATMSEIATSGAEQSTGLQEITTAVHQLDQITQHNAQMVEHAVRAGQGAGGAGQHAVQRGGVFPFAAGYSRRGGGSGGARGGHAIGRALGDQFLRSITDKNQPFHDRDMYVFALDSVGTYLAFGGNSAKVGTRVQDIPGIAGEQLVQDIMAQAEHGPGWVEYDINNPATGKVQTKMSFVTQGGRSVCGLRGIQDAGGARLRHGVARRGSACAARARPGQRSRNGCLLVSGGWRWRRVACGSVGSGLRSSQTGLFVLRFAGKAFLALVVAGLRPVRLGWRPGVPAGGGPAGVDQRHAIDRTDRDAQLAARAMLGHHGVHELVRAHDGIGRAGLDAQGAANAPVLVDQHHAAWPFDWQNAGQGLAPPVR